MAAGSGGHLRGLSVGFFIAAISVIVLAPLGLSGCIPIQIIPGATADENIWLFGSSKSSGRTIRCENTHRVRLNLRTQRGWVSVHHTKNRCNDESRSFDRWRVMGFREDRPPADSTSSSICDPCGLELKVEEGSGEVEDIRVVFFEPSWMRILVKRGGTWQAWDAVVTDHGDPSQVRAVACDEHRPPEAEGANGPPELSSCFARIEDGYLGPAARELEDPLFFDDLVLSWMADHGDDMSKVVAGLVHFMETHSLSRLSTWESARDKRPESTRASIRQVIEETDCADVVEAGGNLWFDYIEVLEEALDEPRRTSAVNACLEDLARVRPEDLEAVDTPFRTADILRHFDEAIEERTFAGEAIPQALWFDRLEKEPEPSQELLELTDRRLLERFPMDHEDIKRRLEHDRPISSANLELLKYKFSADHFEDPQLIREVFDYPGMEPHRDGLDEALIDALSEGQPGLGMPTTFKQRIAKLDAYPMSSSNMERLMDVLVSRSDALAGEAIAFVESAGESRAQALLARLDGQFAEEFPRGGEFFLKRLNHDSLTRPTPAVKDAVLERAREFKERGEEVNHEACQSVRLLNSMSPASGRCTLPDNL